MAYGTPLTEVSLFSYMGRMLSSSNDNWLAVEQNLRMARGKWGWLEKILGREVAYKRTVGGFYVAVVQVLI